MSNIKITECRCCGNRDAKQFIEKGDGYICKCCGVWFRYETEEERDGCLSGYRQLRKYKFEDARDTFEEVLVNFPGSIDARWGLLLSRFGVVYIKGFYDNVIEPVYCFPDYEVLEGRTFQNEDEYREMRELIGSDTELKYFYDAKAREIDRAIKKFRDCKESTERDVFICVKISASTEKEKHGINERTKDYEFALRAYKDLQARGMNVFFSFVTLKNEVNSDDLIWLNLVKSKKMLLIGSREDYLESAWVKSEWKRWRFLDRQKDMYICVLNEGGDNPKNVLPYELRKDAPQIYTPDTYSKLLDDICGVDYSATKAQATVAAPIAAEETSKQNEKVTDAARKKVLAKIEADEKEKAEYAGKDGKVIYKDGREEILPHGTGLIKSKAYYGNLDVVKVIIPDSVTAIGGSAFFGCTSLESVIIPESVRFIGEWAFDLCSSMRHVTLPSGITNISSYSFLSTGIMSISIPAGVTYIRTHAFHGCHSLRDICFYGTEEEWEVIDVANNNDAITTATVHFVSEEKKNIDGKIVYEGGKTEVIKYGITEIAKEAYKGCKDIERVILPGSVVTIGDEAFAGCENLENIIIPDSVITIGDRSFTNCKSLTNIVIPDSVKRIMSYAFYGCQNIENVIIPDSVREMGESVFSNCESLAGVKLSASLKSINKNAFWGCRNLSGIEFPDSVIVIEDNAFYNCSNLSNIEFPRSIENIGVCAFQNCNSLKQVLIPNSVASVGNMAFSHCQKLTSASIACEKIGEYAFERCENLCEVTFSDNVRTIGGAVFLECFALNGKEIEIPSGVCCIEGNPFGLCRVNLTVSPLNKYFKMIDGNLYTADEKTLISYMPKKNEVSFSVPESVTRISDHAFRTLDAYGAFALKAIYIPKSVQYIGFCSLSVSGNSEIEIYFNGKKMEWEKITLTTMKISGVSRVNVPIGETVKNGDSYHPKIYAKVHFKTLFGYTK